jgi:hypothetical protein
MKSHFIERMTRHLRSKPCPKGLVESWHQLEQAVATAAAHRQWQAIQWPTGSGKTEALTVLCATPDIAAHPGALILIKFTDEADEVARRINTIAGSPIALAAHHKAPVTAQAMNESPVLIATHEAYRAAPRNACDNPDTSNRLDLYHRYEHNNRSWVIIDEAFDWIDAYEVDLDDTYAMCAALSVQMRRDANLDRLSAFIDELRNTRHVTKSDRLLCDQHFTLLAAIDIEQLRSAIKDVPLETIELWRNVGLYLRPSGTASFNPSVRPTTFKNEYVALLNRLETIKRIGRCWTSQRGDRSRLHSSRLLLDTNRPCGVILDATASIDRTYDLLGDRVAIMPRPTDIRSYANVMVHVSRPHHVGKQYLAKHAATEWPTLVSQLRNRVSDQSDVLVITQKGTKEIIKSGPSCGTQVIGHWGDLDGKNNWSHCNTAVIFGLPYLDDIAPTDVFHACTGLWSNEWFAGERGYGRYADVKSAFKHWFIAKSVIQAINRVRCRTIIDDEGNCARTDVFILLPRGAVGDAVLAAIQCQMPGAKIEGLNALTANGSSITRSEKRLLSELRHAAPGVHTKTQLIERVSITSRTFERMTAQARKTGSVLSKELVAIGAEFRCTKGRGREAYFIKH